MKEKDESTKLQSNVALHTLREQEIIPSKHELDAFRMKAITLLKHHEVRFASLTEKLHLLRDMPIEIEKTSHSKTTVAMQQTISTLPGETINLKGAFKRYPESHCRSIPIPESFHLATQSNQSGFPHPSQHNGWALSQILLPENPILIKKMKEVAQELLPKGSLNIKAKELLKLKQQSFNESLGEFSDLHKKLHQALLMSADLDESTQLHFFESLKKQKNPYIYVSTIHMQTVTHYIEKNLPSEASLEYVFLMGTTYQRLLKKNKYLLETLAEKQLHEFLFELETFNIKSTKEMHQWIKKMLLSDIEVLNSKI